MEKPVIIRIVFIIAALVLLLKVAQLQLFDKTMRSRAQATAIEKQVQYPSRGLIYDRNGTLLVYNDAIYDLLVVYNKIDPQMDTTRFCQLLDITREQFVDNLKKPWGGQFSKNVPFVFLSKIQPQTWARFSEHLFDFPGFTPRLRSARGYAQNGAAHVLGYISEVNKDQISASVGVYESGDYIGTSGLERAYEPYLRGAKGVKYILKDNIGREVGPFEGGVRDSAAISGSDLISTLDINLQVYAEKLMANKVGAITAIEPNTGEILAMVSSPSYDPNLLTINQNRGAYYAALAQDSLKPLFDRTVLAQYPPGSIFKTVVGLIALQEGVTTPYRSIRCGGGFVNAPGDIRKCHGHPAPTNISIALQYSCNAYFFTLFKDLVNKYGFRDVENGLDNFYTYLSNFGFGQKLTSEIDYEATGFIPNSAYYDNVYKNSPWYATTIVSLGIGQGELSMTTLQMANLASILGNRGFYIQPHLLKQIRNQATLPNPDFDRKKLVRIDPIHFGPIIDGMAAVVTSGTARMAQVPGVEICGKTGTVQNPHGEDHSVFIAFAPRENPKIAIAVYVENAGGGGRTAAPVAGLLVERYLNDTISVQKKPLETQILNTDLIHKNARS